MRGSDDQNESKPHLFGRASRLIIEKSWSLLCAHEVYVRMGPGLFADDLLVQSSV
jgi:hypothetical protein